MRQHTQHEQVSIVLSEANKPINCPLAAHPNRSPVTRLAQSSRVCLGAWPLRYMLLDSTQHPVRYPFAWKTVSSFVLRQKAKGPPDDMVTLEVERNT